MPSFSNLRSEAEERWKPEEGSQYSVVVVEVRNGETKNGYPSIGLWLEVIGQTTDAGERFWDNTYFSANKRGNAMSFAKLEAVNPELNEEFWAGDPDSHVIESMIMGKTFKAQATYEDNRDGGDPWLRCTYIPAESKEIPSF